LTFTHTRPYSGFAGQRSDPLLDLTSSIDEPGVALVVRFAAVHQRDCVDETAANSDGTDLGREFGRLPYAAAEL
jgi:hypothetical protein